MKHNTLRNICMFLAVLLFGLVPDFSRANTINVQDSIFTNTHWTACNQYLLFGYVYVCQGATLTIDPGTIIKGDKNTKGALIVERGSKIMAQGTAAQPIIFTSNQPMGQRTYGDWGGVILCGKAPVNWLGNQAQVEGGPRSLYGGTFPHDNSGVMSYVRIEFAGVAFSPNNEVNGLTFCGVGDATQIDHIQVSYSGDDSYEWFGGTVNVKYLVAYRGWDDDFDQDNGWRGHGQFAFGIRDPYAADVSGSKGMEMDSYQNGTKTGLAGDTSGLTMPVWSNVTLIGPMVSPTTTSYDPQFVSGIHQRRGNASSVLNSVIVGFPCGILFDESSASFGSTTRNLRILGAAGDSISQYRGDAIAGIPTTNSPGHKDGFYVIDGARSLTPTTTEADTTTNNPFAPWSGPYNFIMDNPPAPGPKYFNHIYATEQTGLALHNPFNLSNPNETPTSVSPICYNSTSLPAYVTAHYNACCSQSDHFGNGNKYPFNPLLPINTDTSNFFANYNAPSDVPVFNSGRITSAGSFFVHTNYIGAFAGTQTTSDDWTQGWCNWDPVNTDYSASSAPVATATPAGSTTICPSGGSVVLNANTGSGYTYQWLLNGNPITGATFPGYTATSTGAYSVVVTNSTGCSTTSTAVNVTTFAPVNVTITPSGATTFCNGGSVTLTSNQNSNQMWTTGATTQSIMVNTSGIYNVTFTDNNGCANTATAVTVTVNPNPNPPNITAGGPTSFCTGDSVMLTSSQSTGNMWSPNGETTQSIYASVSGNYSVTYTNANGCSATSNSIQVQASAAPLPTISASGPTTICPGGSVVLSSSAADTYSWSTGATTQSITVTTAGNYNVTTTNANACNGVGTSSNVSVSVNPAPTAGFTFQTNSNTVTFTNTSSGGTLYNWDFGDSNGSTSQNPTHVYASNGTYTVTLIVTNAQGCTDTVTMTVPFFLGIAQQTAMSGITVFPNPTNDNVNIAIGLNTDSKVSVMAYDMTGKVLVNEDRNLTAGNNTLTYDVNDWSNGIYFLRITVGTSVSTVKVVIAR